MCIIISTCMLRMFTSTMFSIYAQQWLGLVVKSWLIFLVWSLAQPIYYHARAIGSEHDHNKERK